MILCDTNVFIEAFKKNPSTMELLRQIGFHNIALSAITLMELYFGALNKNELTQIKSRLGSLSVINIDIKISKAATSLIEKYSKSHGLQIPDALIAATAISEQIDLFTYNLKDFRFIEGIKLYYTGIS